MTMWECLDAVEDAGNASNGWSEDLADTAGRLAWVMDGASSVFPTKDKVTSDKSDARWLVEHISKYLASAAGEKMTLAAMVAQAIESTAADADREWVKRNRPDVPPSAALGVIRQVARSTEYLVLADVSIVMRTAEGIVEYVDHRVDAVNELAHQAMAEALQSPGATFDTAIKHTRPYLAEARRSWMNQPGGYWVAWVDKTVVEHADTGAVDDVEEVVLATDGFMRGVHLFGFCSLDDLFRESLVDIAEAVRKAELADPNTRVYPRWSVRDDICAQRLRWLA